MNDFTLICEKRNEFSTFLINHFHRKNRIKVLILITSNGTWLRWMFFRKIVLLKVGLKGVECGARKSNGWAESPAVQAGMLECRLHGFDYFWRFSFTFQNSQQTGTGT